MWQLWSPLWKDTRLPEINTDLVADGREHFKKFCSSCHGDIERADPGRRIEAKMASVGETTVPNGPDAVDTDPTMAVNFLTRTAKVPQLTDRYTRYWAALSKREEVSRVLSRTRRLRPRFWAMR